MVVFVECLPSMYEALSIILSLKQNKTNKVQGVGEIHFPIGKEVEQMGKKKTKQKTKTKTKKNKRKKEKVIDMLYKKWERRKQ